MSKKHSKRLRLESSPLLLTDIGATRWAGGVAFIDVQSGPLKGSLALGPHLMAKLRESAGRAMRDNASPLNPPKAAEKG